MMNMISKTLKFVLPVAIVVLALLAARLIGANKPEPKTRDAQVRELVVDATRLNSSSYPVVIRSQGTVQPTLSNTLVPAIAGTVIELHEAFVVGGRFSQGDLLLKIDPRDFEIALKQAQANLSQVDAQLEEELALAEQARAEWRSLGRGGQPSALTFREPQVAAAQANRDAAIAQVEIAELDLERTQVLAPYEGIVSERLIDLGQFVARGAPVGTIHSIHAFDVRLPLSNRQLTYLILPESSTALNPANVELNATIGAQQQLWIGALVRAEGIDPQTQQLNVIARVNNPYSQSSRPLRSGQFVQALVQGQVLENVFVVPRSVLREGREVLIVDDNNEIHRRSVNVAWSDDDVAAIDSGLVEGDVLVLTPLSTVSDGTPVRATIDGVEPEPLDS